MAKTLDVARALLLETVKQDSTSITPTQLDQALQTALHDFARRTHCVRSSFMLTVAANTWMTTMTPGTSPVPADWVRERTQSLNVRYNNLSTWSISTAYAALDMIQNNGTPDALWYVCTVANMGVQPPNTGYWRPVTFDTVGPVILATEAMVRDYQCGGRNWPDGCRSALDSCRPWPGWECWIPTLGVPIVAAFRDDNTLVYWPFVTTAAQVAVQYWQPFTTWTLGDSNAAAISLNIPDDYIDKAITTGAAGQLMFNTPAARISAEAQFEAYIKEVAGTYAVDTLRMSRRAPGIYV